MRATNPCQECGKPAIYKPPRRWWRRRDARVHRRDHDVCARCWAKLMASVDARTVVAA
jgi:DNA-directed RNA polymerase subunit RPC12/RpoP